MLHFGDNFIFGDDININLSNLILFALAVVGFTHIIVDPATIMKPFRNFVSKYCNDWINKLFSCYQCCGTWIGFFCGFVLISRNIFVVFLCGMAGSFLSTWAATYLNYLEAKSIISIGDEDEDKETLESSNESEEG
jgi:hypothetical protein